MRFLLDVCAASRNMHALLTGMGHDVLSALERDSRAADEDLLELANEEQRILITEDKDFGELVFVHQMRHPCIIRFVEMHPGKKVAVMRYLIEHHADDMRGGAIIVVMRDRVRIRPGRHSERGIHE